LPELIQKKLFVIVPQHIPSGPVKGAMAICNFLCDFLPVTFVAAKTPIDGSSGIRDKVRTVSLANAGGFFARTKMYRQLLKESGPSKDIVSLSMCLYADAINLLATGRARRISSIRGNLPLNYFHDYGLKGYALAASHLMILHGIDEVLSMSDAMSAQLRLFGHFRPVLVRNFIDEAKSDSDLAIGRVESTILDDWRTDGIHFAFVGSLSQRKRPDLVIKAVADLRRRGIRCSATIMGSGPLQPQLREFASRLGVVTQIRFLGQVKNPLSEVRKCDYLLLPSHSEGIPRAALEALYAGVPCIMRDVDANRELITRPEAGGLFKNDSEFPDKLIELLKHRKAADNGRSNLLPDEFRQATNCQKLLELIHGND
jgi:glycosyltransferase involved in cell wall biosynthesis